ncbi:MAG: 30S ribosomal protein S8 [Deltaproteobacteria bacterium]|nr:30S ribosomal protein S8 [Candidatus Anaeroferrophillacea bacterium]
MSLSDPIADLLTRIRNASMVRHERVDVSFSKLNSHIVEILQEEGFIKNFKMVKDPAGHMQARLYLKYDHDGTPTITGLRRESRPGLRRYVKSDEIPMVLSGLGINILSTSRGVMTGERARDLKVGGELLCSVW